MLGTTVDMITKQGGKTKPRTRPTPRFLCDTSTGLWWVIASDDASWEWSPIGMAGPITFQEVRESHPSRYTLDPIDKDSDQAKQMKQIFYREWRP